MIAMKKTGGSMIAALMLVLALALSGCSGNGAGSGNGVGSGAGNGSGQGTATDTPGGIVQGGESTSAGSGSQGNGQGKRKVVFATFWPDERFAEAKKKFEELNPDIEIELQYIDTNNSKLEADLEKFVKTTNTAMLAGKGPDILEMDQLPIEQYVQKGLLVDLETLIERDATFKREQYFANILDNAKVGGGLYGMPLSFFLMGFAGDVDSIAKAGVQVDDSSWTWDDFAAIGEKLVKGGAYKNAILSMPESILTMMVMDDYETFVDVKNRKASFESQAFIGRMKEVKAMAENGIIGDQRPYFFHAQINSPGDYMTTLNEFGGAEMRLYAKPHAKETGPGGYFRSYRTIGLSAASTVKQEAWKFIKFMMSDDISATPLSAGFPINKALYEKGLEELRQTGTVKGHEEGPLHGASVKVDDANLERLTGYVNGAVHPVAYQASRLEELILQESAAFFSGQKTAEAVAKLIQNKATTYLNE
jgi:multiple sugar transport system substrate-binding protein